MWLKILSNQVTLYVACLAYIKKSDILITKTDWLFFLLAMASLPLWYLTADPLWAIVILTAVDVLGFVPTFRTAYSQPFKEQLRFFVIMAVRNLISILALEHYSLTTVLFPAVIAAACLVFILMVLCRRRVITVDS